MNEEYEQEENNLVGICPLHGVRMEEKDGQYGPYFSHKATDGYCNGRKITPFKRPQQVNGVSTGAGFRPNGQVAKRHDTMFVCNAMNNAVALVNGGTVDLKQLEDTFNRVLEILETKT